MDKDYFINDNDGYNWVSLSKPLSNYTQQELAEHLINNKKEYGTTQKIRIDGKIGAILTTDFCETPQEFLDKYQNILDRAGFEKGNNMGEFEVKEENKSTLTIKPKALSKVSLMDYTQEELAHLIMDDKINNNDGTEYGIYEHRETIFDSTGCNTIEDFINKYQEEFRKRRIKSENPNNYPKKDTMRIIEIPLGMVNYTQEDIAHLVMDNKKEDEVVGIKVNKGVIFDSRDCTTVEDFINKNESIANKLGIKHNIEEKIEKVGKIEDIKYSNNFDPIIPRVSVSGPMNKKVEVEEPKDNYQEELNKLLKTRDIKIAINLFNIPRGNNEDSKINTIEEKNNEYLKIFNEKDNLDFTNEELVSTWFNNLIPYINTHALELNINNESVDKYLVKLMEEKGYSTDETKVTTNKQKDIARKLNEIDKYHFVVSEYNNLPEENKNLNSEKVNDEAEINYLQSLVSDATRGLNLIGLDLAQINNKTRVEKELLETQVDLIDKVLVEKGDNQFEDRISTSDERKANDAYKLASITYGVNEIEKAISYINMLPDDSSVKENLSTAAYALFNKQDAIDYQKYPELNDRDKYLAKLDKIDEEKEIVEARLKSKEKVLIDYMMSTNMKLANLNSKYNKIVEENNVVEKEVEEPTVKEEVDDQESYNFDLAKKEGLIDKLKNKLTKEKEENHIDQEYINKLESIGTIFTDEDRIDPNHSYLNADNAKNLNLVDVVTEGPKQEVISKIEMEPEEEVKENIEEPVIDNEINISEPVTDNEIIINEPDNMTLESNDYDLSLDDEYYDLSLPDSDDDLNDFVTIRSFRQISKDLYDRINQDKVKQVVKKAVKKLGEVKKAACIYLGIAAVIVGTGHVAFSKLTSAASGDVSAKISVETITNDEKDDKVDEVVDEVVNNEVASNSTNEEIEKIANNPVINEEEKSDEYTDSLDAASNETLSKVLEGKQDVYKSFADAYTETNAVDSNSIYVPSWENATGGEYFVEEDGVMNRLSKDEAEDYYKNGQEVVQSIKNDGTVIGYVNIENNDSVKGM